MNCVARFVVSYIVAVFIAVMPVFSAFSGSVSAAQVDAVMMQEHGAADHHGAVDDCDAAAKKDCGGHEESLGENCCVSACQVANVQAEHNFLIRAASPAYELVAPLGQRSGSPLSIDRPPKQA